MLPKPSSFKSNSSACHGKQDTPSPVALKILNVNKFKLPSIQEELAAIPENHLTEATSTDWDSMKMTVHSATLQVFGLVTSNH